MKATAIKALEITWAAMWTILLAPFLIPAYAIAKLLGADPMSLDGMGIGFLVMALIAGGLFIAAVSFGVGYFFG